MGGGGGGGGGVQKIMCVQAHQEHEGEAQSPLWLRSSFSFRILDAHLCYLSLICEHSLQIQNGIN